MLSLLLLPGENNLISYHKSPNWRLYEPQNYKAKDYYTIETQN